MAGGGDAGAAGGEVDPLIAMGINPDLDPELAMAIRMSLEEAKQAENAANADQNQAQPEAHEPVQPEAAGENVQPGLQVVDDDDGMYDDAGEGDEDERLLAEALALSMMPNEP